MIRGINGNVDAWSSALINRPGEVCIQPIIKSIAPNGAEGVIYLNIINAAAFIKCLQTAIAEAENTGKSISSTVWIDDWM